MASVGINFRATSGYVTDGAGETYSTGDSYPTTRGGFTFGWVTVDADPARDRNSALDRRLAGMNQVGNSGTQRTFRLDLATSGSKNIRLAIGDAGSPQAYQYVQAKDNTTVLFTINDTNGTGNTGSDTFDDATATGYSAANWPGSNTAVAVTMSSTILNLVVGSPTAQSNSSTVAHIYVEDAAAGDANASLIGGDLFNGRLLFGGRLVQ